MVNVDEWGERLDGYAYQAKVNVAIINCVYFSSLPSCTLSALLAPTIPQFGIPEKKT